MNIERFKGICLHVAGRMNESLGELTRDTERMAEGRRTRMEAIARQRAGVDKERSDRQMRDFLQRNRHWHF
jgi:uncharacterized protein YjbJ (UPF0337 family)